MSENRSPYGHDCEPTKNPADQPLPPSDGEQCSEPDPTTPPSWEAPEPCWTHDPCCKCPSKPEDPPNCLQDLIAKQVADSVVAKNADEFKEVLEDILKKAQVARLEYTRNKYDDLIKEWERQDEEIATRLIRPLVCDIPCWKCILDCYVCPLINDIYVAEKSIYDDGELYTNVHDLEDLQYWHHRNREAKKRDFERIQKVLTAWDKPGDSIAGVLTKNAEAITAIRDMIGKEPGKAIFHLFLDLIPKHLAIAPPATKVKTRIDKKFTEFCKCEDMDPNNCCGPDTGPWLLRLQSIQPQAYLIDPNDYFKLICCLVKKFYAPAKDALTKAEVGLANASAAFEAAKDRYKNGLANFAANALSALPSVIDCCDYDKDGEDAEHEQQQQRQSY